MRPFLQLGQRGIENNVNNYIPCLILPPILQSEPEPPSAAVVQTLGF